MRNGALEALALQPDAQRVDAIARTPLHDPDPAIRSRVVGMVAFYARPGGFELLASLADDPDPHVRLRLGWCLGKYGEPAVPTLRALPADPDEQVREFAARGLDRIAHLRVEENGTSLP